MKKILFIVLFAIVLSFAKADTAAFIDPWVKSTSQIPINQQFFTFSYEDVSIVGGKGILFAGRQVLNSGTFLFSGANTFEFNNPTRSVSFVTLTYNGANTFVGNPCQTGGDQTVQLSSGSCGFQNIQQPGLDFDLSSFHALGFNILYKDVPGPNRYGVRLWFKNGQTGFAFREYSPIVTGNESPLLYFPLSEFGSAADISSGLAAFSVSIYNQVESVDNLITAIQFFQPEVEKTVSKSSGVDLGETVSFTVTAGLPKPLIPPPSTLDPNGPMFTSQVDITDTLDDGFEDPTNVVVMLDGVSVTASVDITPSKLMVGLTGIAPNFGTIKVTYDAKVKDVQPTCSNKECNNVVLNVKTAFNGIETTQVRSDGTCIDLNSVALGISETAQVNSAKPGETVTFTIVGSNTGTSTLHEFTYTKTINDNELIGDPSWTKVSDTVFTKSFTVDVLPGATHTTTFVGTVQNDVAITTTQTCNSVTLKSNSDCDTPATTTACAPVNPGQPDISLKKSVATTEYTYYLKWTSQGTGDASSVVLHEDLQAGWSLSPKSKAAGWECSSMKCWFAIGTAVTGTSGTVEFIVDVAIAAQNDNEMCWHNHATVSFDDAELDKTADNVATASIGSQCKECCDPKCPPAEIQVQVPCPSPKCVPKIPEYWCPPCQKDPPACTCSQCTGP